MGRVRDVTEEMGSDLQAVPKQTAESSGTHPASRSGFFDKILGKAKTNYRKGMRLSFWEGKYADAIPYFDKAIEIDPSNANVWHDRGVCYRVLGKDSEALRNFDRAVELSPDDEEFMFSRAEMLKTIGILRQRQDLLESAVQILNRVVEKNPNHAEAWNCLGICSKELGKELSSRQYFDKSRELIKHGKNKKKTRSFDFLT